MSLLADNNLRDSSAPQAGGAANTSPDRALERRVFELETEIALQKQRVADLGAMGAIIASHLDGDRALTVMMEMAIRTVGGEVGAILMAEKNCLEIRNAWGLDRSLLSVMEIVPGSDMNDIYHRCNAPIILNKINHSPHPKIHIHNILLAPIQSPDRKYGMVVILNKEDGGEFTQDDGDSAETLTNFLAVAIENAALLSSSLEKLKMDQEMAIASMVQEAILPDRTIAIPGMDLGVVYVSARQVGGDFYDIFKLSEHECAVIIGDVSNKGVPAALVMAAAVGVVKSTLRTHPEISMSALAEHLNDTLSEEIVKDKGMFATMWLGRCDLREGALSYCNAGHIPPLFRNAKTGLVTELATGGPIIGQFPGIRYTEGAVTLCTGDTLFACTDGLTEAEDAAGKLLGRETARQMFEANCHLSSQEACARMKAEVDKYSRGTSEERQDDMTLVMATIKALGEGHQ